MGRTMKGFTSKHTLTEKAYACIKDGLSGVKSKRASSFLKKRS